MLFMTALFTCFTAFFVQSGWQPGPFGVFLVVSDISIIVTAIVDLTENATHLYKYIQARLSAFLSKLAMSLWVLSLFFFFYWLPWVAVVVTIGITIALLATYLKFREDFDEKEED